MYEPCEHCKTPDSGPGADCCKESLKSWVRVIEGRLRAHVKGDKILWQHIEYLEEVNMRARDVLEGARTLEIP